MISDHHVLADKNEELSLFVVKILYSKPIFPLTLHTTSKLLQPKSNRRTQIQSDTFYYTIITSRMSIQSEIS